ncbi:NAD-specific glutamate dehydrogenase [Colletotrichum tofieldiae]|nr:NAD-specific glutamate dehydrogenase [Colletotrichum tofieldiae]
MTVTLRKEFIKGINLVDLLDGGAVVRGTGGATSTSAGEAARGTAGTGGTASAAVELHHDGVGNALELLLALLVLLASGLLVLVEPGDDLVDLGLELLLVVGIELLVDLGVAEGVAERVGVRLEAVLGRDAAGLGLILVLELLGLGKHALDVLLGEAALVVGDDNLVGLAGTLLDGGDVHDTVGIEIEGDLNLGTPRGRGDAGQLELAEQVVVLGALALTLVDLDEDTGLVVGEGGEDLGLLGGDGGVAGMSLGEGRNIEKQDLVGALGRGVTGQDGGLDGGTVGNGLIGVDGLVGLLAVEVVGDELLDAGIRDDLVDLRLVDLGVSQDAVDGLDGGAEQVLAQLLEARTGDGGVEVDALEQRVDLDGGLGGRGQGALGTLASGAETAQRAGVGGQVLLVLALELVDEVVDEAVVEVLTTQVGVTSGGLDLEDALLNGQEGHIEGTTTEIEDENVALALGLLVQAVRDGGGGGLVDDAQHVEAGNETGVLGSLTLGVVEVGGDSDDGVVDLATEESLGSLAHLDQDHGRDLLGRERLGLALELDLDVGLAVLVDHLEREP